nr:glycoside hydrolase family 13 protein [Microlunatus phosphovorus]
MPPPSAPPTIPSPVWWHTAVVYQIYPRSFADANADGMGDLQGIVSRVPYLAALGVDAVWLSPFYPSALADGGYDVDDYRDVDPRIGSLADFDELVTTLHAAGIKVLVDIVPNHSSDRHVWFAEALASPPGSPARDRYIFRDGTGPDGSEPPNDWQSLFGGSAWAQVADGQWYLHLFAAEQPDLNWDNASVREDFRTTLRFWSDRGVDGFRVDVAHGLVKDLSTPYAPWPELEHMERDDGSHPLWDRDDLQEVYRDWRTVFDSYDPPRFAVAEAGVHPARRARYAAPTSLGQAFNFAMQEAAWRLTDYREVIESGVSDMIAEGSTTTWLLGCHDTVRVVSRYGLPVADDQTPIKVARSWLLTDGTDPQCDVALGTRRARAAILVLLALPGSVYVYQGEELGLPEVPDLPAAVLQDPVASRSGGREKGRDGCRVPLPWSATGASYGFGAGAAATELPQPAWFAELAAATQADDEQSMLTLYRRAIALRRELAVPLPTTDPSLSFVESDAEVLHFRRGDRWHSVTNFGDQPVPLPLGTVLLSSVELVDGLLPTDATAWVSADSALP